MQEAIDRQRIELSPSPADLTPRVRSGGRGLNGRTAGMTSAQDRLPAMIHGEARR